MDGFGVDGPNYKNNKKLLISGFGSILLMGVPKQSP